MDSFTPSPQPISTAEPSPAQTVEVRARIPAALRDQLEQLSTRSFRSIAGEVAAACSSWVEQHASSSRTLSVVIGGAALLSATPALSQTCGVLGSPYGVSGCVVPGQYGAPSVRIKSDPINPGGFRSTPVAPTPAFNGPMPPGLNRDYSRPNVPGLY